MKNDSQEILTLIKEIYLKTSHKIEDNLYESGLTHQQIMVLKIIDHEKEINISKLCEKLCLSKGTVSGIVNRLEKANYIKKQKYDFDKRNTYISFSTKGNEFNEKFKQQMDEIFNNIFVDMTQEELKFYIETLNNLKSKMKN